jgi:uncharacterized protein
MRPSEVLAALRKELLALAAAQGVGRLRVFGSAAKGTDRADSDLDLLVDAPEGTSLLRLISLQQAIADLMGVRVDHCTERELHPALRARILAEARVV